MGVLFQSLIKPHVQKQLKTAVKHQTKVVNKATRGGATALNAAVGYKQQMNAANFDSGTGLPKGKGNDLYKSIFWSK